MKNKITDSQIKSLVSIYPLNYERLILNNSEILHWDISERFNIIEKFKEYKDDDSKLATFIIDNFDHTFIKTNDQHLNDYFNDPYYVINCGESIMSKFVFNNSNLLNLVIDGLLIKHLSDHSINLLDSAFKSYNIDLKNIEDKLHIAINLTKNVNSLYHLINKPFITEIKISNDSYIALAKSFLENPNYPIDKILESDISKGIINTMYKVGNVEQLEILNSSLYGVYEKLGNVEYINYAIKNFTNHSVLFFSQSNKYNDFYLYGHMVEYINKNEKGNMYKLLHPVTISDQDEFELCINDILSKYNDVLYLRDHKEEFFKFHNFLLNIMKSSSLFRSKFFVPYYSKKFKELNNKFDISTLVDYIIDYTHPKLGSPVAYIPDEFLTPDRLRKIVRKDPNNLYHIIKMKNDI